MPLEWYNGDDASVKVPTELHRAVLEGSLDEVSRLLKRKKDGYKLRDDYFELSERSL